MLLRSKSRIVCTRIVFVILSLLIVPKAYSSDTSPLSEQQRVLYPELQLQGAFIQGGMVRGLLPPGSKPSIDGTLIEQNDEGFFVFGFGRDANETSRLAWRDPGGKEKVLSIQVAQREYPTQYVEGVPQKTVTPDPSKLARIREETRQVREARERFLKHSYFLSEFIIPLKGPITGVYGSQRVYNGVPKRPHYGIDYAAPVGTPVVAPADAVVTLVHQDMYYSGGTLIMDHGYGLSSTFIHLSEVLVKEGDVVRQGQAVGKVGAGGRASGPHLDWRVNWFETRLDPALVLITGQLSPRR